MKMMIEGVNLPMRKTIGACGYDIYAPKDFEIRQNEWVSLDTGILMEKGDIPEGCFAMIDVRSGIGTRNKFRLANTIGIIDSDYTMDTIKATVTAELNKDDTLAFKKNDRILQMIIVPFMTIRNEIPPVDERTGGHGSTGLK